VSHTQPMKGTGRDLTQSTRTTGRTLEAITRPPTRLARANWHNEGIFTEVVAVLGELDCICDGHRGYGYMLLMITGGPPRWRVIQRIARLKKPKDREEWSHQ
jgi:hypothetical protein